MATDAIRPVVAADPPPSVSHGTLASLDSSLNTRPLNAVKRKAMATRRGAGVPFLVIGLAFLILGASGRRAFLAIGLAFLVLGIVFLMRQPRAGG